MTPNNLSMRGAHANAHAALGTFVTCDPAHTNANNFNTCATAVDVDVIVDGFGNEKRMARYAKK